MLPYQSPALSMRIMAPEMQRYKCMALDVFLSSCRITFDPPRSVIGQLRWNCTMDKRRERCLFSRKPPKTLIFVSQSTSTSNCAIAAISLTASCPPSRTKHLLKDVDRSVNYFLWCQTVLPLCLVYLYEALLHNLHFIRICSICNCLHTKIRPI